jgi:putative transposase
MNETWSMDFVEDRLENGRRIRTLNIIDDYNREALAMEVSFSFPAEQVIEVINQCIEWRGKPQKIRSDNGTEFIAGKTKEFFSNREILHIPIQKGKPSQNGYIERFNRSYREGVLDAFILSSLEQAREETMIWMQDYNHNHPHESLGDKSPVECL